MLMRARLIAAPSSPMANKKVTLLSVNVCYGGGALAQALKRDSPQRCQGSGLRPFLPEQRARIISRGRVMDWLLFVLLLLAIGTVWNYRGEKSL
jgi:hypothetical protein